MRWPYSGGATTGNQGKTPLINARQISRRIREIKARRTNAQAQAVRPLTGLRVTKISRAREQPSQKHPRKVRSRRRYQYDPRFAEGTKFSIFRMS